MALKMQALVRKASWNLIDQVISSLTNAALSIVVARSVDESTFGGFAIAFGVFALLVGLSRAIATSPLSVRFTTVSGDEFGRATAASVGTSLSLGLVSGLACVGAGLWIGGVGGQAVVALGAVLPGLLMQDAWRQVFFAAGKPAAATLNDAVWAVVQFGAVAALLLSDLGTVGPLVLAWGGAALAAALLGIGQSRILPRPALTRRWLRDHRDLTGYVVAEFGTQQGAQQGAMLIIPVVAGLAAAGALRGAQVLLGVTSILAMAAFTFTLPEFSRRRDTLTTRQWMWGALGLSGLVAGAGVVWGLLFVIAPVVGQTILGDTWNGVGPIMIGSIVGATALALGLGPSTMLRAMDRAQVTFGLNALQSPLVLIGGVGGVLVGGTQGAVWGFAAAYWTVLPLWWIRLRREAARVSAAVAPGGPRLPARPEVPLPPEVLLPPVAAEAPRVPGPSPVQAQPQVQVQPQVPVQQGAGSGRHRLTRDQRKAVIVGGVPPTRSVDAIPIREISTSGRPVVGGAPLTSGRPPIPGPPPAGGRPPIPGPPPFPGRPPIPGPPPVNGRPPIPGPPPRALPATGQPPPTGNPPVAAPLRTNGRPPAAEPAPPGPNPGHVQVP